MINKLNSTHLSNETEKPAIAQLIFDVCPNIESLKSILIEKDQYNNFTFPLISLIRGLNEREGVRNNYSFATKFCHYSCYYLFDTEELEEELRNLYRDTYPIYDSIVSRYLRETYNIGIDFDNYSDYVLAINC